MPRRPSLADQWRRGRPVRSSPDRSPRACCSGQVEGDHRSRAEQYGQRQYGQSEGDGAQPRVPAPGGRQGGPAAGGFSGRGCEQAGAEGAQDARDVAPLADAQGQQPVGGGGQRQGDGLEAVPGGGRGGYGAGASLRAGRGVAAESSTVAASSMGRGVCRSSNSGASTPSRAKPIFSAGVRVELARTTTARWSAVWATNARLPLVCAS